MVCLFSCPATHPILAQGFEPRWDYPSQLAPLPGAPTTNQDSNVRGERLAERDDAIHYDTQLAPAGYDSQPNVPTPWQEIPGSMANRQAATDPLSNSPGTGRMVCDGDSCRIEPSPDEATQTANLGALVAPNTRGASSVPAGGRPPQSWFERVALQASDIDWKKMLGSLALVIGGYFGFVYLARRIQPGAAQSIPKEVIEVVGVARLDARHQLQLIRLGSKLLLVSVGPEGAANLGEISHSSEVEQLVGLCSMPKRQRANAIRRNAAAAEQRRVDPNLALEQLVQSLQQAIRRTGSHAEFEA